MSERICHEGLEGGIEGDVKITQVDALVLCALLRVVMNGRDASSYGDDAARIVTTLESQIKTGGDDS